MRVGGCCIRTRQSNVAIPYTVFQDTCLGFMVGFHTFLENETMLFRTVLMFLDNIRSKSVFLSYMENVFNDVEEKRKLKGNCRINDERR